MSQPSQPSKAGGMVDDSDQPLGREERTEDPQEPPRRLVPPWPRAEGRHGLGRHEEAFAVEHLDDPATCQHGSSALHRLSLAGHMNQSASAAGFPHIPAGTRTRHDPYKRASRAHAANPTANATRRERDGRTSQGFRSRSPSGPDRRGFPCSTRLPRPVSGRRASRSVRIAVALRYGSANCLASPPR
jgi:hypothetical protein